MSRSKVTQCKSAAVVLLVVNATPKNAQNITTNAMQHGSKVKEVPDRFSTHY